MRDPGVEVRPIVTMDGGREINTVYLTDVKVPVENRIGEENKGWTYAKFLLGHERFGIARLSESKARLVVPEARSRAITTSAARCSRTTPTSCARWRRPRSS